LIASFRVACLAREERANGKEIVFVSNNEMKSAGIAATPFAPDCYSHVDHVSGDRDQRQSSRVSRASGQTAMW
jgi:hypothetical protein